MIQLSAGMDILAENPAALSAGASLFMAVIWMVYLNIVVRQHRRSNRPFLIIHHAHDNDPDALCLFVNMSKEPVHVQCVLAKVRKNGETVDQYVTDFQRINPDKTDIRAHLKQGPIHSGGYLVLGTFGDIIRGERSSEAGTDSDAEAVDDLSDVESLELCLAVIHGPSSFPIGARRRFFLKQEDGRKVIRAQSVYTEQLTGAGRKRTVRKWIEGRIEPLRTDRTESEHTEQSPDEASDQD